MAYDAVHSATGDRLKNRRCRRVIESFNTFLDQFINRGLCCSNCWVKRKMKMLQKVQLQFFSTYCSIIPFIAQTLINLCFMSPLQCQLVQILDPFAPERCFKFETKCISQNWVSTYFKKITEKIRFFAQSMGRPAKLMLLGMQLWEKRGSFGGWI